MSPRLNFKSPFIIQLKINIGKVLLPSILPFEPLLNFTENLLTRHNIFVEIKQRNMLDKGSTAPNFTLKNQEGKNIELYKELENGPAVIFFYPKDGTPGCTAEACAFRDSFQDFTDKGITVLGISADNQQSHEKFSMEHQLPYDILSDPDGHARKAYDVKKTLWVIPGRATFVIDQNKKIIHNFNSQSSTSKHVQEALSVL